MSLQEAELPLDPRLPRLPTFMAPRQVALELNIGLTKVYEHIASGKLRSFMDGKRKRQILGDSVSQLAAEMIAAGIGTGPPSNPTAKATEASLASRRLNPPKRRMQHARQMANAPTRRVGSSP